MLLFSREKKFAGIFYWKRLLNFTGLEIYHSKKIFQLHLDLLSNAVFRTVVTLEIRWLKILKSL